MQGFRDSSPAIAPQKGSSGLPTATSGASDGRSGSGGQSRPSAEDAAVHRCDGAAIERGQIVHCAVQPRDLAIVRDVWRDHFLTTDQLLELWWPEATAQAGRRRLGKLFPAGLLYRFRPLSRRGSNRWTYHLGAEGHGMLVRAGAIRRGDRFNQRTIYDPGHVLHDLQFNALVLAWRRLLGEDLVAWHGETELHPQTGLRRDPTDAFLRVERDSEDYVEGLRDECSRLLRPDAVVEVGDPDGGRPADVLPRGRPQLRR